MMIKTLLHVLTGLAPLFPLTAAASLVPIFNAEDSIEASNVPLIIWHGFGDAFDSDGMKGVGDIYRDIYPGSAVYSVRLAEDSDGDRRSSFFGNLNDELSDVCQQIQNTKDLRLAKGANMVGFSQGGLFARGLVERCNSPRVRNLMTFGSPHNGINTFANCADDDWWCNTWSGTLKSNTWTEWVQSNLVPAQYFRDASDLKNYRENSNFLADVNNEREKRNETYADNIASLDRFVLIRFKDEDVVKPVVSPWFGDLNTTNGKVIKLGDRALYRQDWLGLKELDNSGGLLFQEINGRHMQIGEGVLEKMFSEYFAQDAPTRQAHHQKTPSAWDVWDQAVLASPEEASQDEEANTGDVTACGRLNSSWARLKRFLSAYYEEMAANFG